MQFPLHCGEVAPASVPNDPAGHSKQAGDPGMLYWPAAHTTVYPLTLPTLHAYPAGHGMPTATPDGQNKPAGQGPAQLGVVSAEEFPKYPTRHASR